MSSLRCLASHTVGVTSDFSEFQNDRSIRNSRRRPHWCDAKRVEVLERKETTKDEIGVLNAKQCLKLLETAKKHYPECVSGFAGGVQVLKSHYVGVMPKAEALLGICFLREAPERAIASDRRAGKWGLQGTEEVFRCCG